KTGDPYTPSKLSKPPFEGFEGDRGCALSRILKPSALVLPMLREHCPDHVERGRWQQAVEDGRRFLDKWGEQAAALGWMPRDLFGLQQAAGPAASVLSPPTRVRRARAHLALAGRAGCDAHGRHRRDREPHRGHHRLSQI